MPKNKEKQNIDNLKESIQINHLIDLTIKKFDSEKAFDKFLSITENENLKVKHKFSTTIQPYFKYAALLVIAFMIGFYFIKTSNSYTTIVTVKGQKTRIELEDGTKIWLNASSKIAYKKDFLKDERIIKLSGEAYFEVAKLDGKPFLVELQDNSIIKVLGTSFDVKSYPEDTKSIVTLLEGKIKLVPKNDISKEMVMEPGTSVLIENSSNTIQLLTNVNSNSALLWRNDELDFNKENLKDIVNELNRVFNVQISIKSEELNNHLFTASFKKGTTITNILKALSISGNFNFKNTNSKKFEIIKNN